MKTNKLLVTGLTLSLAVLSVSCSDHYQEGIEAGKAQGYTSGYDVGYDDGHADGDEAGYARGQTYFQARMTYDAGFTDGRAEGVNVGFASGRTDGYNQTFTAARAQGYTVGKVDGLIQGRVEGYNSGYDDGYDDGFSDRTVVYYNAGLSAGRTAGYNNGYGDGYDDGVDDGYSLGYEDGMDDGYDVGYDDGYDDALGLSVGKTSKLKGYSNLLSMAHNDLINYDKIPAPKKTSKGLSVNGKLIFEETSLTNKDTAKRAAVVEQYLIIEMSKQVQSKFGLSAERSFEVARAANHFRKQASKRALTVADTNAYVSAITGTDLGTIVRASEAAIKGEMGDMNAIIQSAAKKNEVSPEKMAQIISLF